MGGTRMGSGHRPDWRWRPAVADGRHANGSWGLIGTDGMRLGPGQIMRIGGGARFRTRDGAGVRSVCRIEGRVGLRKSR